MKCLIFTALLIISVNCLAQNSFTCNYGQRPACLGYGDKIVDSNAACFNQYACGIGGGFVCKSKLDEAMDDYNTLVRKYNELLKKHKELADSGTTLVDSHRELESLLNDCNRKQRLTEDDLSELQEQLQKSKMEADDLRSENMRLLTELNSLRQQRRKTSR